MGRALSAEKDIGVSKKIEMMLECRKPLDLWRLQRSMQGLLESEKPRWTIQEKKKPRSLALSVCAVLGTILVAALMSVAMIVLMVLLCTSDSLVYVIGGRRRGGRGRGRRGGGRGC